jgi:hypothetical protein
VREIADGAESSAGGLVDPERAAQKIPAAIEAYYQQSYPRLSAQQKVDIAKAAQGILDIYNRNVFPEHGVTWGTYANNLGHMDSPGCFEMLAIVVDRAVGAS